MQVTLNFDHRVAVGMAHLIGGAAVLAWSGTPTLASLLGPLAITAACLAWCLDNDLTRKVSPADPLQIVEWKGLVAGRKPAPRSLCWRENPCGESGADRGHRRNFWGMASVSHYSCAPGATLTRRVQALTSRPLASWVFRGTSI